jgi:hypothetical protein
MWRTRRGESLRPPSLHGRLSASTPAKLPPREWLYDKHYQRGIVTATVGPGGGGKSSLDLVELIAMCTGRDLLGVQPLIRCRAWYHNAEDSRDEIYRRIAAVCQHYKIDQGELDGWLFVTTVPRVCRFDFGVRQVAAITLAAGAHSAPGALPERRRGLRCRTRFNNHSRAVGVNRRAILTP